MSIDKSSLKVVSRDYRSIYRDLVSAIPTLTTHWDTNDESDPGIVLVKLMSMLGDMLSFNTDMAYLEAFPDTVKQRKNAYQIFKLIGYKMNWYRSCKCDCYISIDGVGNLLVPRFTMFTSEDNKICYTNPYEAFNVTPSIGMEEDPRYHTVLVEGIPVTPDLVLGYNYTDGTMSSIIVNENNKWHGMYKYNVDEDYIKESRIYFRYPNVDQDNIILIDEDGEEWKMVDNITLTSEYGNKIYEFCVDEFDNPYLRLVGYWRSLSSRFKLFYVRSSGESGFVSKNVIKRVSGDLFNLLNRGLPSGMRGRISIINYESSIGHDPETPDEARDISRNYINTFNTLVTLSDFTKFICRNDSVINGIALDYTNDFNRYRPIQYESIEDIARIIYDNLPYSLKSTSGIISRSDLYVYLESIEDISSIFPLEIIDFIEYIPSGNTEADSSISKYYLSNGVMKLLDEEYDDSVNRKLYIRRLENLVHILEIVRNYCKNSDTGLYQSDVLNVNKDISPEYYYEVKDNVVTRTYYQYSSNGRTEVTDVIVDYSSLRQVEGIYSDLATVENTINARDIFNRAYYKIYRRSLTEDMLYLANYLSGSATNRKYGINIYVTPRGYDDSKYEDYAEVIEDGIDTNKCLPVDVITTNKYINYYSWGIKGIVYLKNPVTLGESNEILFNIDSKLKNKYGIGLVDYNFVPKPIDVMNDIISADPSIYYVDLEEIEYERYDSESGDYWVPSKDKSLITGDVYVGDIVISPNDNGEYYIDLIEYSGYTEQEILQGEVLIRPSSVCVTIESGTYVIHDNGYGSLVCNENILESGKIEYGRGAYIKFKLLDGVILTSQGQHATLKLRRNRLSMAVFSGISPELIIDHNSLDI